MGFPKEVSLKNKQNLIIDKASLLDAAEIVDFLNKVGGQTDFLTFGENEFPFSVEEEKIIIKECIGSDLNLMLLGKINTKIVSQLFLQRSSKKRLIHIVDIGISVCKNYWGNSTQNMLNFAIGWAKDHGITKIQLQVRIDNKGAIVLYKKLGFVI
ncbi:MAG: GNAT family N-acetyltransferase [Candidatus Rickettsia vulgarisii]